MAAVLDVPYYVLDYVDEFRRAVVEPFGAAYLSGSTPNPCVECNRSVRFSALLERTEALGCDVLVTGHHARVARRGDSYRLLRAVDGTKDQSYVLYMLGQAELSRIRLPVGEMTKDVVRARAAELGLRTAAKPDSQDLCFVGRDYRGFLAEHFPESARPGDIVDTDGVVVGGHQGTSGFTIGQRRGIGVSAPEPRYVVDIEPATATVVIGRKDDLLVDGARLGSVSFVAGEPPVDHDVEVKVRYRSRPVRASLEHAADGAWAVAFSTPQPGVAPGQAAVLYRGDEVLGGGTIVTPLRAENVSPAAGSVRA